MSQPDQIDVVKFISPAQPKVWKVNSETFEDLATSPADPVRHLTIHPTHLVTAEDEMDGGRNMPFSTVVRLELSNRVMGDEPILNTTLIAPFHTLSPVKSLVLVLNRTNSSSGVLNLIHPLPRLEGIVIGAPETKMDDIDRVISRPFTPPPLTGTLKQLVRGGVKRNTNLLLYVPGCLHFRKILLVVSDMEGLTDVMDTFSDNLQFIEFRCRHPGGGLIDLSKAKKLREVSFIIEGPLIAWVLRTVKFITYQHQDLRRISIRFPREFCANISTTDFDRDLAGLRGLLVDLARLLPSLAIYVEALCNKSPGLCGYIGPRFPEVTSEGLVKVLPHLPPEIVDGIIDLLRGDKETLKQCSLVSKQWVPCCRRYLFDAVEITSFENLEGWKKTFPESAESPACYARSLRVDPTHLVTAGGGVDGDLIKSFTRVVQLKLWNNVPWSRKSIPNATFAPFRTHALSSVKSLILGFAAVSSSEVLDLICSLPHLEDLEIDTANIVIDDVISRSSTSPPLTGTLTLNRGGDQVANLLKSAPGGLRFRKIILGPYAGERLKRVKDLVVRCSDTLECIEIRRPVLGIYEIDLSKAKKLREVSLIIDGKRIEWVLPAVKFITGRCQHLQSISIRFPRDFCDGSMDRQKQSALITDLTKLGKSLEDIAMFRQSLVIYVETLCSEATKLCNFMVWRREGVTRKGSIHIFRRQAKLVVGSRW